MGPRTEHGMLPPESAAAIYRAIDDSAEKTRVSVDACRQQTEAIARVVEKISNSLDEIKAKLAEGAVRFERQSGEIKRVDARVDHLQNTVEDVESDFNKFYYPKPGSTPRAPVPAIRYPNSDRTPQGVQTHTKPPVDEPTADDIVKVKFNWNKILNILLVAGLTAVGTWFGTKILDDHDKASKTTVKTETTIETKNPPLSPPEPKTTAP